MTLDQLLGVTGYFAFAVLSAVAPWVNAEILMLSALAWTTTPSLLMWVIASVTAGQMTGKSIVYWISRRSGANREASRHPRLERWRCVLATRPYAASGLTFVSSLIGFPPFFLISIAAGSFGMNFGRFLAAGTAGRALHFTLVACGPEFARRLL